MRKRFDPDDPLFFSPEQPELDQISQLTSNPIHTCSRAANADGHRKQFVQNCDAVCVIQVARKTDFRGCLLSICSGFIVKR